jgi:hypothetical protein
MGLEGKPKNQSEKCEVSSVSQPATILPSLVARQTDQIDSAIIA